MNGGDMNGGDMNRIESLARSFVIARYAVRVPG
jgi:hypothetical protein